MPFLLARQGGVEGVVARAYVTPSATPPKD
jgi:hypothetical protein